MTTTTENHRAAYWKYTGNHSERKDCSQTNKWNYSMDLIQYLAFFGGEGVKVYSTAADQFGKMIVVSAPKSTWEEARINCAKEREENPFEK